MEKARFDRTSERPIEVSFETVEAVQTPAMRRDALRAYAKAMLRAYIADQEDRKKRNRV
jgi:hypothetical protein